jgi:hypothetical protein
MKSFAILAAVFAFGLSASAQDKPRVFVQGKGSENLVTSGSGGGGRHWGAWGANSTLDSHDEGMEVTKDLQKNCSGVTVTLNQSNADYIVMLNRESKHNRGLLRTNSQVQVANRAGDILGTNSTRTVGNAAKDACELVLADWQTHGRLNVPASGPSPVSPVPTPMPVPSPTPPQNRPDQPQQQSSVQTQQVVTSPPKADQPQPVAAGSTVTGSTVGNGTESQNLSLGDAARWQKQHRACLELAKDNPNISCK